MSEVVKHRGDVFKSIAQPAQFTTGVARHHRRSYDDYEIAKAHILQAVGDLGDIELFGKQVLCAVFCRPNMREIKRASGEIAQVYTGLKEIQEDWWQTKGVLILKCGPAAFTGEDSWLAEQYGANSAPKPGDWLFAHANTGIQINLAGDGASRPQALDFQGEPVDLFEWDGWPCRVIPDDQFYGRLTNPQAVV